LITYFDGIFLEVCCYSGCTTMLFQVGDLPFIVYQPVLCPVAVWIIGECWSVAMYWSNCFFCCELL